MNTLKALHPSLSADQKKDGELIYCAESETHKSVHVSINIM